MLELHTIASITTSAIALEKLVKKNAPITAGLDISPPGSVEIEYNTTHPTTPTTPPINTYGFLLIPETSRLISAPQIDTLRGQCQRPDGTMTIERVTVSNNDSFRA